MSTRVGEMPPEMRALRRWVCAELVDGRKVPMRAYEHAPASVSAPETWSTFEEAASRVEDGTYPWLGFVFAGDGLVGIDVDGCVEGGVPDEGAMGAVRACASYTELSCSGRGVHIVCRASLPFEGRKEGGWEAYSSGRFFLMTGRRIGPWRECAEAQGAVDAIVAERLPGAAPSGDGRGPRIWEPRWELSEGGRIPLSPRWSGVGEGSRHLSLVSYCGRLVTMGWPRERVLEAARAANARYMDPPLGDAEVASIAASCERYRR